MATATADSGGPERASPRNTYVDQFPTSARVVRYCFAVAFTALAIGGLFGMIQALHRTDTLRTSPRRTTTLS